ncbi:MAG: hypothetical protein JKY09_00360, partial [Crocinitomicaceae bacterium]|nr:hypothetical protein [Crocinitomicaceae bacterium]
NPKLWWPLGQGEQNLYNDTWSFSDGNKIDVALAEAQFGIKTSELVREADEWGTSYYFKINGRRIFCKGANYIPQDIFPARVEDHEIKDMVENMAASNFNMVRVWGGGYYPDEVFYKTCDQLGIMVWQDLMFACSMYPGDDDFIHNVSKEFNYQVPRISYHPSVVLFNGNNEVEVAWGNWGFQIKYGLFGKSAREIEAAYDRLFKQTAPEIIERFSSIPYIHTSPLSNWGKAELYNHGSQHYWGVWHGRDPIQDFGKKIGRFNAEYGFQSFPEYNTIKTFAEKSDWDLSSEVMKHHQKSYVGNDMILKHARKLYGSPKSFEEFVYFSQLTQSMAVSMAVAGHRIDAPRCGGTLYWQLNDCWPAPSWSSIDYYGNWKALQYRIREDYEDVTVVAKYNDLKHIDYYFVSGIEKQYKTRVVCKVVDLKGKELVVEEVDLNVNGQESVKLSISILEKKYARKNVQFNFSWLNEEGKELTRSFDFLPKNHKKAGVKNIKFHLEGINKDNGTAVLVVENDRFVQDLWMTSEKFAVKYTRNFISLTPGRHEIKITFEGELSIDDFNFYWL